MTLTSVFMFVWPSACVHGSVSKFSLFRTQSGRMGPTLMSTSWSSAKAVSQYIHKYWSLGLRYLWEGYDLTLNRWGEGKDGLCLKALLSPLLPPSQCLLGQVLRLGQGSSFLLKLFCVKTQNFNPDDETPPR